MLHMCGQLVHSGSAEPLLVTLLFYVSIVLDIIVHSLDLFNQVSYNDLKLDWNGNGNGGISNLMTYHDVALVMVSACAAKYASIMYRMNLLLKFQESFVTAHVCACLLLV